MCRCVYIPHEYSSIALVMQIILYMRIMMHHLFSMCIVVQFHMEILWNNSGFSHEVLHLFVHSIKIL